MWGSGLRVSRPSMRAVGSPSRSATQPWATSWTVTASSKAGAIRIRDWRKRAGSSKRSVIRRPGPDPAKPRRPRPGTFRRASRPGPRACISPSRRAGPGCPATRPPPRRPGSAGPDPGPASPAWPHGTEGLPAGSSRRAGLACYNPQDARPRHSPFFQETQRDETDDSVTTPRGGAVPGPGPGDPARPGRGPGPVPAGPRGRGRGEPGGAGPEPGPPPRARRPDPPDDRPAGLRPRARVRPGHLRPDPRPARPRLDARDLGADLRDVQDLPGHPGEVPPAPRGVHRHHHRPLLRRPAGLRRAEGDHHPRLQPDRHRRQLRRRLVRDADQHLRQLADGLRQPGGQAVSRSTRSRSRPG